MPYFSGNEQKRKLVAHLYIVIYADNDVDAYEQIPTGSVGTANKHGHAP